jgi:pyridoxal phosphate enzyme (YggS family)
MPVTKKLALIQNRIAAAAQRAGRNPGDITLMAVSKTVPPELIREAYSAGLRHFGENRVQEFSAKRDALRDLHDAEWHMIGHLQTNKAAKAAELFMTIDSVDSLRLAQKLDDAGQRMGTRLGALIEINAGGELAKSGLGFDSAELERLLRAAPSLKHLEFRGLMTVPPFLDDPERVRPWFRKLRELRDRIAARQLPEVNMNVLSMGMSHDFEVAIEEGSTCVRLGTAIFGERSLEIDLPSKGISSDQSG